MARRSYSPEVKAMARVLADDLSPRQQRFVEEYLIDDNAAGAYVRAGYVASSPQVAAVSGHRLLNTAKIQAALAQHRAALAQHAQISREGLIDELKALAFSRMSRYVEVKSGVNVLPSEGWTDSDDAAVAEVSETTTEHGGTIRLKLHDKLGAIDKIAKLLGYYPKEPLVDARTLNVFSADDAIRALLEARKQLAVNPDVNQEE